jgi:hypothetical protein
MAFIIIVEILQRSERHSCHSYRSLIVDIETATAGYSSTTGAEVASGEIDSPLPLNWRLVDVVHVA